MNLQNMANHRWKCGRTDLCHDIAKERWADNKRTSRSTHTDYLSGLSVQNQKCTIRRCKSTKSIHCVFFRLLFPVTDPSPISRQPLC